MTGTTRTDHGHGHGHGTGTGTGIGTGTGTGQRGETARALGASADGLSLDWQRVLHRRSFLELDALGRAKALLDDGSIRVLCGPFERLESPWLEPQNVTPQSDDGVIVARGTIDGTGVVVLSIEQKFQGGGTGEVSGAKISQALRLAAAESRGGTPVPAVLLLETGGVRLQEANLGLNAVAEICSALLELRPLAPVVGVVAGSVGSFGGISIATGLCTHVIVTPEARIGLNGAAVIEQEAGVEEFDSSDHALVWAVDGGEQRRRTGLADTLVVDDADALRDAVRRAVAAGTTSPGAHRSERLDVLDARLATLDPADPPEPARLRQLWGETYDMPPAGPGKAHRGSDVRPQAGTTRSSMTPSRRGRTWITALAGTTARPVIESVLRTDTDGITYLAVVPDPDNHFYRARQGQVGLTECSALARTMREITAEDEGRAERRAIVAVVDLPSQAYGRIEEMAGLHQAIASAVDATDAARVAGHPSSPSSSDKRSPAVSSPTASRPPGSSPSMTPVWRSTPCTRRPPPRSPCAPSTNSTNSPRRSHRCPTTSATGPRSASATPCSASRTPTPRPRAMCAPSHRPSTTPSPAPAPARATCPTAGTPRRPRRSGKPPGPSATPWPGSGTSGESP